MQNMFVRNNDLHNESDVEQFFLIKLLTKLGYDSSLIRTKSTISEYAIGKKTKNKRYSPDYIVYIDKRQTKPIIIIDAKSPNEDVDDGVSDAQMYASILRRKLKEPKPEQFCIGTNGNLLIVKHFDSDKIIISLRFEEFVDNNENYKRLIMLLSRDSISVNQKKLVKNDFDFSKPNLKEIKGIFEACHNVIWRKEVMSPESAFYEFAKLMFVKLNEDKRLHKDPELKKLIDKREPLPISKVHFCDFWIDKNDAEPNPINSILFRQLREELEWEIKNKKKKRIFESNENIDLDKETIKEVVSLIQNYDLISIDEDLNGRLFETFLSATMRGRELGQFFTPRNVVDFMTELANLQVTKDKTDYVLDGCCGTGGFLIEAMAKMTEKIDKPPLSLLLTEQQRENLKMDIRNNHLYGIDAGKKPPISRIARINMYLHGDGGSKIFFADALNKDPKIDSTLNIELRAEREELKDILSKSGKQFDVILTNPPFAMKYKAKVKDQEQILLQYSLSHDKKGKLRASLNSNVMFLERYTDLLNKNGKLLTVIDESVLNTDSNKPIRNWIFDKFYIKAIISLPRWAFFQAGSNVKTSILYLEKREIDSDEEQQYTFYAKCNNIGFDKMKPDESRSDLPHVLETFRKFISTGSINNGKPIWKESSRVFIKKLTKKMRRIDFEHLDPRHDEIIKKLKSIEKSKGHKLETLDDLCDIFTGKTAEQYVSIGMPIIKSKNVTNDGIDWNTEFVLRKFFDENKDKHLKQNDILMNTTGVGTLGRTALFDKNIFCMTDGHVTILRIKDKDKILPDYILFYLRSIFGQSQIEKFTVGSTGQTELNDPDLKQIYVLYPESRKAQEEIIKEAKNCEIKAMKSKAEYLEFLKKREQEFSKSLIGK